MVILEVFIGLFFLFVLLSLFASIIQELISSIISLRGKVLVTAFARFIGFEAPKERFVFKIFLKTVNPTYKKLISSSLWIKRYPSYLSKEHFISIIQDLYKAEKEFENQTRLSRSSVNVEEAIMSNLKLINPLSVGLANKKITFPDKDNHISDQAINRFFWIRSFFFDILDPIGRFLERRVRNQALVADNINWYTKKINPLNIPNSKISRNVEIITAEFNPARSSSDIEIEVAKNELYQSYEEYMGRAKGWFKRKVQLYLIVIGFIIAFIANADTIAVFEHLSSNPIFGQQNSVGKIDDLNELVFELFKDQINPNANHLGIGWDKEIIEASYDDNSKFSILCFIENAAEEINHERSKFWGFLITALAISLGANFWFDLLILLVNIRNTGKRPDQGNTKNKNAISPNQNLVASNSDIIDPITSNDIIVG